jgi:P2-related tail formation protein
MPIDPGKLNPRPGQTTRLFAYLPAIFQEPPTGTTGPLPLGRLLMVFESILMGLSKANQDEWPDLKQQQGFEEILGGSVDQTTGKRLLEGIDRYFDPGPKLADPDPKLPKDYNRAPEDFLSWLAKWVSLTLREDWEEDRKRDFIARAVQLYRLRGTRNGVAQFVQVYTGLPVDISEQGAAFQLGVHSQIGVDTILDSGQPFFFRVKLRLPKADPQLFQQQKEIATAIIEMQKPAHTTFNLEVETPQFQIGVQSTVGVDTLLGQSAP